MTSAGFEGSDPPAGDLEGEGGAVDPAGGPPGADVSPCFCIFFVNCYYTYSIVFRC